VGYTILACRYMSTRDLGSLGSSFGSYEEDRDGDDEAAY